MNRASRYWLAWLALGLTFITACREAGGPLAAENVLFQDAFVAGQTGSWEVEGDALGRTAVVSEQLVIEIDTPNTLQFTTLAEPTFTDFVLEVEVRQLAGSSESSFGVLFRLQDPSQFYRFDITGSGLYMVERRNADGSWTRFVEDWTANPAINQGLNLVNRLKVVANGPLLSFYVNDILLQQVNDPLYTAGSIALDAGTFGQPGLRVAFDNVLVQRP